MLVLVLLSFDWNLQWKICFKEGGGNTQHTSVSCILTQPTKLLEESLQTHQRSPDSLGESLIYKQRVDFRTLLLIWNYLLLTTELLLKIPGTGACIVRGEPQCGKKKSLSLSQRVFWYSTISILSISMDSISSLFLLLPSSFSSSVFCLFISSIVKISPKPWRLGDFCLACSTNWSFGITVSYLGA